MKKLVLLVLVAVVVATVCTTSVALASNPSDLAEKIKKLDGVDDVKIAIYKNTCFVAVKPRGVMQKSQYNKLRQQIVDTVVKDNANMQVAVSFSVKLFCQIEKIEKLPAEQKQQQLDKLLDRLSKIPMPLKNK